MYIIGLRDLKVVTFNGYLRCLKFRGVGSIAQYGSFTKRLYVCMYVCI